MVRSATLKILLSVACLWSFFVIGLGAYTRLTDAGLSCPDWPGCYGHVLVSRSSVVSHKVQPSQAWSEMVHRYFAGTLGILILMSLFFLGLWIKQTECYAPLLPAGVLLALLIYQPLLGMWTVTEKLLPIVVTQHLLGGLAIFVSLWWIRLVIYHEGFYRVKSQQVGLRVVASLALLLLFIQLFLGAWTSTNYAAMSCSAFPFCSLTPWQADFKNAFRLGFSSGVNYQGGILSDNARMTIQMVHRYGALVVGSFLLAWSVAIIFISNNKRFIQAAFWVIIFLLLQVALGIANVLLERPLLIAVMHNLMAALLALSTVNLAFFCFHDKLKESA